MVCILEELAAAAVRTSSSSDRTRAPTPIRTPPTPVGIKVYGPDLAVIERIGKEIEAVLPDVRGTRSVFAERVGGGYFLDFDLKREQLARYGLSVDDAQMIVMNAPFSTE